MPSVRVRGSHRGEFFAADMQEVDRYITDIAVTRSQVMKGTRLMANMLALIDLGQSQQMSLGPVDPRQTRPEAAWQIPVRRITGRYFTGWQIRRHGLNAYEVFNDSREAYYIEHGIHTSPRRRRRPVRKLALIRTLRFADSARIGHRVWEQTFRPLGDKRHSGRGQMFSEFSMGGFRSLRPFPSVRLFGVGG